MRSFFLSVLFINTACASCTSGTFVEFAHIRAEKIQEASGLDYSRQHKGVFWTHNDSGDSPTLYALNSDGKKVAQFEVNTEVNDWEDISVGQCLGSSGDCLYVADTGNKKGKRETLNVLMIEEPKSLADGNLTVTKTISFPGKNLNFESLALDEKRQQFYLLNKVGRRSDPLDGQKGRIALFTLSPSGVLAKSSVFDFSRMAGLENQDSLVTAADFDPERDLLLIGTYGRAFEIHYSDFGHFPQGVSSYKLPGLDKAEAMAFDGQSIVVTSEGKNAPILRLNCTP